MSLRKALFFSYADKYSNLVMAIVSSMVLARLLTPKEIGIYSVSAVFAGLISNIRDLSAGTYIIQERELNELRVRATFTLALGVGFILSVVLFGLSHPLSKFYREAGVQRVMILLAVNFLVVPFGSVRQALLARDMRFDLLAYISVASAIVNAIVCVTLAFLGFSYTSIAWAAIASSLVSAILTYFLKPLDHSLFPSIAEIRRVVSFGSRASGAGLLSEFSLGAPDLIIGRLQTLEMAGLYGRAQTVTTFFQNAVMRAVHPIIFPYIAQKYRDGSQPKVSLLAVQTIVTGLAWPFFAFVALMAFPVMRLLFGPQWDASVDAARILCLSAAAEFFCPFSSEALLAVGAVRQVLQLQTFLVPVRIALILIGAQFGLNQLAFALVLSSVYNATLRFCFLRKTFGFTLAEYLPRVLPSGSVALATAFIPAIVLSLTGLRPANVVLAMALAGPGSLVCFLLSIVFLNHPLFKEIQNSWTGLKGLITGKRN